MRIDYKEKEINIEEITDKYMDVQKFLAFCRACPYYGKNHSCPEHDFDTKQFLLKYRKAVLIYAKITLEESERNVNTYNDLLEDAKAKMVDFLNELERNIDNSQSILPGPCRICKICAKEEGKPCRHPELKRYSLNSLGCDTTRILKDYFDVELQWVKNGVVPQVFSYLIGLLY